MLENYLIIHKSILPEYYEKVLAVRHLMESGRVRDVSQAVKEIGISRSTYYKYKDYILEPSEMAGGRKAVLSMMLAHEPGVLSVLAGLFARHGVSIASMVQKGGRDAQGRVQIVFLTHRASERAVRAAVSEMDEGLGAQVSIIRVEKD